MGYSILRYASTANAIIFAMSTVQVAQKLAPYCGDLADQATYVLAWSWEALEFEELNAKRNGPNTWEITEDSPLGDGLRTGDLVRCELSDGELLVNERLWSGRLL